MLRYLLRYLLRYFIYFTIKPACRQADKSPVMLAIWDDFKTLKWIYSLKNIEKLSNDVKSF